MKIANVMIRGRSRRHIALYPPTPLREPSTTENHSVNPDEVILKCGGIPTLCEVQPPLQSQQAKLASPKTL
ncbi:MAG: hypothetical protein WA594_10855 [Candidatus Sulfotelmatobacter sp.]